jgi:hypothetical protein
MGPGNVADIETNRTAPQNVTAASAEAGPVGVRLRNLTLIRRGAEAMIRWRRTVFEAVDQPAG